jgi:dethiobiotin synthetase
VLFRSGAEKLGEVWVNEDVALLRAATNVEAPLEWVNPYLFREAIAPHIAADHKGVRIEIPHIREAWEGLSGLADVVLVEGVGGLLVPLSADKDMGHLAQDLGLPLILVVGLRLGCINHALLTVESIAARGLKLSGWVANQLDPDMEAPEENIAALARRIPVPLLAEFPWLETRDPARMAAAFPPKKLTTLLGR